MYHPFSFWFDSLDVESQEVNSVVNMGDFGFLLGQFQVERCTRGAFGMRVIFPDGGGVQQSSPCWMAKSYFEVF
jgi:hypothetical protein